MGGGVGGRGTNNVDDTQISGAIILKHKADAVQSDPRCAR